MAIIEIPSFTFRIELDQDLFVEPGSSGDIKLAFVQPLEFLGIVYPLDRGASLCNSP